MIFKGKFSKGHTKCRYSYAHPLVVVYICIKVHENILNSIRVIERTGFSYEKFQRAIIP